MLDSTNRAGLGSSLEPHGVWLREDIRGLATLVHEGLADVACLDELFDLGVAEVVVGEMMVVRHSRLFD